MDYIIYQVISGVTHHWLSLLVIGGLGYAHERHRVRRGEHHLTVRGAYARLFRRSNRPASDD